MKVLLDTCVVSELSRKGGEPRVAERVRSVPDAQLFLSVVTLGELAKGVALLDPGARRDRYRRVLDGLETAYADRLLPVDADTARIWGKLTARARRSGRPVSAADGLIAATALQHGLQVWTRNLRDFEPTGALAESPWPRS